MGLSIPEEPRDIKELIKTVRARISEEKGKNDIDYDALAVWSFNRLPKYLWRCWKDELKSRNINWQKFLKIIRFHTNDLISWALRDELKWEDLVFRIVHTITYYVEKTRNLPNIDNN